MESASFGLMVHNALMCIQRTLANAEDVNGESVRSALDRFLDLASGVHAQEHEVKQLTPEEQIELYRERYKQEYGE